MAHLLLLGLTGGLFLLPNWASVYVLLFLLAAALIAKSAKYLGPPYAAFVLAVTFYITLVSMASDVTGISGVFVAKLGLTFLALSYLAIDSHKVDLGLNAKKEIQRFQTVILIIALALFGSQIAIYFKTEPFYAIFVTYYVDTDSYASYYGTALTAGDDRNGGLFTNPNQLSKALTFLLMYSMLMVQHRSGKDNAIAFVVSVSVLALSCFFTGSRTGALVFILTVFLWMLRNRRAQVLSAAATLFVAVFAIQFELSQENRLLDTGSAAMNSLQYKMMYIDNYLAQSRPAAVLFGQGATDVTLSKSTALGRDFGFDSDVGFLVFHFGVVGTILLFAFLMIALYRMRVPVFVYPMFLWVITSSIFFNVKSLLMLFLLLGLCRMSVRS